MKTGFVSLIRWLASTVEDQSGSVSSKRVGFFWCLWMLNRAIQMPVINEIVIYAIIGLAFGLAGLTLPEWFATLKTKKNETAN